MTITGFTHGTSEDVPLQRFEVFTGTGRRRDWSDEEKDRIVAESHSGEMSGSGVARRYGLSPGHRNIPTMSGPTILSRTACIMEGRSECST
ncbi:transposase [Rhizobium sp. PP-F2F-G48]|uniref:transposase n=1 Tax=Rhizobium sp. PP-F2F-G48 TaxID=2135651 RepID=UPI00104A7FA1|nr:transposase [Rhizobium sp. PP-F2F-G48]